MFSSEIRNLKLHCFSYRFLSHLPVCIDCCVLVADFELESAAALHIVAFLVGDVGSGGHPNWMVDLYSCIAKVLGIFLLWGLISSKKRLNNILDDCLFVFVWGPSDCWTCYNGELCFLSFLSI